MPHAVAQVIATRQPSIALVAGPDQPLPAGVTAVAAFRCLPRRAEADAHLAALTALFDAFCLADPLRATLQARLTILPDAGVPAIQTSLLAGVTRERAATAIAAAEELARGLPALLDRTAGFQLVALEDGELVNGTLRPFPVVDGAELGIREEPVGRLSGSTRSRPAWHTLPGRSWPPLLAALDRVGQPLTLAINLRPARLSPGELAYLDDLHRLQALREAPVTAALLRRGEVDETAALFHERDASLTPLFPAPLVEANIWLGAGARLSDLAYGGIVAALTGPAASQWRWQRATRPGDLARLEAALATAPAEPLLETDGDDEGARLARLFVTSAAARLVPLPTGDLAAGADAGLRRPYPRVIQLGLPEPIVAAPAAGAPVAIGEALARDGRITVSRRWDDLLRHTYVIGQTGTGKSSLLGRMALQDMAAGRAVLVVDPAGDLVDDLLGRIPPGRQQDVLVVDPTDTRHPLGLNILDTHDPAEFRRAVSEFIGTLYKVYDPHRMGVVGPRLENMFRCSLLAAQAVTGEATLLEVYRLLVDRDYERWLARHVSDPFLKRYFDELAMTSDFHRSETIGYFASKLGRFAADPHLRAVLCQPGARWSLAEAIATGKIVLVTLRQGQLGPETSGFIGGIVMTKLLLATFARDGQAAAERPPLAVYLDEFQTYATDDAIARMLAGIRKYNVAVTLANQHVHQLEPAVREAIFGNAGTILALRLGANDAPLLAQALKPGEVSAEELVGLPNFAARVSLLEQGERLPAFDLAMLPLPGQPDPRLATALRARSALAYGRDQTEVLRETASRLMPSLEFPPLPTR